MPAKGMIALSLPACLALLTACVEIEAPGECIFGYSIATSPSTTPLSVAVGDSIALVASRQSGCGGTWPVTWTTDPATVATIRSTGDSTAMLRGAAAGNVMVEVRNGNRSGFTLVPVTAP